MCFVGPLVRIDSAKGDCWTGTYTAITAGLGGMRDDAIALAGLARSVAALEDLDTVAAL